MQPRDIRNLAESYQSIYANQETLIEEMESGQHPGKSSSEKTRIKYETEKRRNSAPTGTGVPDKKTGYQGLKDSTDYYTLIKGHLIDEGFASSEENAEKIISVMSENWIDSIIEQMVVNVADVKGGTPAAKFAAAGKTGKDGKPMYTPGTGVGADFKLKGV